MGGCNLYPPPCEQLAPCVLCKDSFNCQGSPLVVIDPIQTSNPFPLNISVDYTKTLNNQSLQL